MSPASRSGAEVLLRKFLRGDFPLLKKWIADERACAQWSGPNFTHPIDDGQLEGYYLSTSDGPGPDAAFTCVLRGTGTAVGHIALRFIVPVKKTGVLQFVLIGDKENRGRGMGTGMVRLAVSYGFREIGLEKITLRVFDFNTAAIRCYEAVGFTRAEKFETRYEFRGKKETWKGYGMELSREVWDRFRLR